MKIICVGRNYKKHIVELKNKIPEEIVFFLKPETTIPQKNQPFFIPDFSNNVHHEIEIVIKINKTGKHIQEKFAHRYYDELTLGIDFTARDIQEKLKKEGKPWEKAKSFDGSAPVGRFIKKNTVYNIHDLNFKLLVNNKQVQCDNSKNMIFSIDQIISYVSKFITLKKGDLIFTGTPSGVGRVEKNDILEGYLENEKLIETIVR
ncbi:MAG: 2-hydroxyhepta-2,4-diene-1,7-dioate isomerase [Flavobacteriales bacterium]|jgi:2-keto-4-pentenoate hydratase/2-oxohepta-3-ene-1,7-dioic acid hydratase in catechol pathway|nr:2-hydroxyhepta-2,4-diene-1,7-dioate isomerase [Flavobacteriales bacterium]|tara:strand:+ start:60 stop:671 length:612 start_codon:yes stop_codon:yes gene_type:complete